MLVLSRKEEESIRIGDQILIKVTRIQGDRVQVAIEAPQEIRILRTELCLPKQSTSSADRKQLKLERSAS